MQEAEIFLAWLKKLHESRAEQERWRLLYEEENTIVGPSLPDSIQGLAAKANYGGALLPGEGEK